jgi:hypothetical protein
MRPAQGTIGNEYSAAPETAAVGSNRSLPRSPVKSAPDGPFDHLLSIAGAAVLLTLAVAGPGVTVATGVAIGAAIAVARTIRATRRRRRGSVRAFHPTAPRSIGGAARAIVRLAVDAIRVSEPT